MLKVIDESFDVLRSGISVSEKLLRKLKDLEKKTMQNNNKKKKHV